MSKRRVVITGLGWVTSLGTNVNEVYAEFFGSEPPARSAVEVARLPKDVLVEIEVEEDPAADEAEDDQD